MVNKTLSWTAITSLILIGVASRFVDHAPNMTPIVGISMLAGFWFKRYAILVPLAILFISNCWLGHYGFWLSIAIYSSFVLPALLGRWASSTLRAGGLALVCACCFFLSTNFVVWVNSGWYPSTLEGLLACYIAAVPFFRNTLIGDLGSTVVIFGLIECLSWQDYKIPRGIFKSDQKELLIHGS